MKEPKVGEQIRCRLLNIGPWMAEVVHVFDTSVVVTYTYSDGPLTFSFDRSNYCEECALWDDRQHPYESKWITTACYKVSAKKGINSNA